MAIEAITMEKVLKALIKEQKWDENTEEYPLVKYKEFFQAMMFGGVTQDVRKINTWWDNMALLDFCQKKKMKHVESEQARFDLESVYNIADHNLWSKLRKRRRDIAEKKEAVSNV